MVVGRVFRTTACPSCRISIVRSFTSLSGPPIRIPHPAIRAQYPTASRARFSSNATEEGDSHGLADKVGGRNITIQGAEQVEDVEDVKEVQQREEPAEVSTVPWYLQVDTPQIKPQPLSERQQIPDLPESPPSILQPLLQRLSVELGLDNLSLLDLRKLDPPPALGANLMMVIGTARSERHLHVSADRLCRWLRSTYSLRPDADGLLGRNELKMKLRRKARRAKLLGSMDDDNEDDGVRTGWVCVDVGVVETAETVTEGEPESNNFVGFGRQTDGVRVVVQMLTEEKREEIDLESLWGGILRRGMKAQFGEPEDVDSGKLSSPATLHSTAMPGGNEPSSIPS